MDKKKQFEELVKEIKGLKTDDMYLNDFFLTWEKSDDELKAVWDVADALRNLRERNISTKVFDSGLAFPYSVITPQELVSPLLPLVTFSD